MTKPSFDPTSGQDTGMGTGFSSMPVVDLSKALVVGRSQINRVVVSKILERSGLRPVSLDPEAALKALKSPLPGAIVLDGGADNKDCDALMAPLLALRGTFGKDAVRVLFLSIRVLSPQDLVALPAIDAPVTKPITPERLLAVLERLRS